MIYAGYTALNLASIFSTIDIARRLLRVPGIDVNKASNWTSNPLSNAVGLGKFELVKLLIEAGADINFRTGNGKNGDSTLLSGAVATSKSEEIVSYLLGKGADANQENGDGTTPLFLAAISGTIRMVDILLRAGADINHLNSDDHYTALYAAIQEENQEIAQFLIKKGADVNLLTSDGFGAAYGVVGVGLFYSIIKVI